MFQSQLAISSTPRLDTMTFVKIQFKIANHEEEFWWSKLGKCWVQIAYLVFWVLFFLDTGLCLSQLLPRSWQLINIEEVRNSTNHLIVIGHLPLTFAIVRNGLRETFHLRRSTFVTSSAERPFGRAHNIASATVHSEWLIPPVQDDTRCNVGELKKQKCHLHLQVISEKNSRVILRSVRPPVSSHSCPLQSTKSLFIMNPSRFNIDIHQSQLDRLRKKLELTDLPDELEEASWDLGSPLADIKRLVEVWKTWDWKKAE